MEREAMITAEVSESDNQERNLDNILQLNNYLSIHHLHGREIYFLDLDRCLRQPYSINDISNNETIGGISLSYNYLIQMPHFISMYTNLIELNVSHNELNNVDFILYKPLNDDELTESYWNEKLKVTSNAQSSAEKISNGKEISCRANGFMIDIDQSTKNMNNENDAKSSTHSSTNAQSSRPLIHPFLENINLSYNHIKSLPLNLHYLRFLHTLDLSHNYLDELPNHFGYLEQLIILKLNNNSFKILPTTFTRLINLQSLNLSHNYFQSIDKIKNFLNLKYFNINSNPLTIFPALFNTCLNLEDISFSNTHLDKMSNITLGLFTQFPKLKKLDLSKNNLTNDFLSSSIQQLDYLEELHLDHNQLTNIFSLISKLKSLYLFDLSCNSLTNIPECLNSTLKILRLSYNNLEEINSHDCIYLKHIIELELDHNQITILPNEFIQCLHLEFLNISFNQFKKFPEIILQLRSLNKLLCNSAQLNSLVSMDLLNKYFYRTLNILDLSSNYLNTNLSQLSCLKALNYLDLSSNQLCELDQDFKLLTCLKVLKLNKNKFSVFPAWLYEMSNDRNRKYIGETLLELYMNDNQLKSLPEEIIHMVTLQTIDLSNNQFPIFPESLVYLEQLSSILYRQEYGIRIDKLPDDFIQLYHLKKLDLSHNSFFEIPQLISKLTKLDYFDMSYNHLTGIENNQLKQFKLIKLNGNNFTSFPSIIYQLDSFNITNNPMCLAPPNDLINASYISAISNIFVQINDQYEEKLFLIYQQILLRYLTNSDIECLLIRLKLSEDDINHFRKNYYHLEREIKIEHLLRIWKEKRNSLANADTLYRLAKLIGDKKLIEQMQRAYLLARRIRI